MTDEPTASAQLASGFDGLVESVRADVRALDERLTGQIESLRTDNREDNSHLEDRLMAALQTFARAHAADHAEEEADRRPFQERVERFLKAAELATARRDGALGVFRFSVELLSRHARPMAQILIGLAAVAGVLSGSISVAVH